MRTLLLTSVLSLFLLSAAPQSQTNSPETSVRRENLAEIINSEVSESRPYISGDGNTLYFCRRNATDNVGGEKDMLDIYMSKRDVVSGEWSNPVNLGEPINTRKNNALGAGNGENIYLINTFNRRSIPLYKTRQTGDGSWSKFEPIFVENYYNNSDFIDIHVSEQHNVMLLAVDRYDTKGDQDLYVSFRTTGNSWTEPKNLGKRINTRKAEFAPFLGSDGYTLFFSSYGHRGSGNADIYAVRRLDDTWENWTKPMNLGDGINTRGEEVYFSVTDDFEYIYLESFEKGESNRDIIRTLLPNEVKPPSGGIDPLVYVSNQINSEDSTIASFALADVRSVDFSRIPQPISTYVASSDNSEDSNTASSSFDVNNPSAEDNNDVASFGNFVEDNTTNDVALASSNEVGNNPSETFDNSIANNASNTLASNETSQAFEDNQGTTSQGNPSTQTSTSNTSPTINNQPSSSGNSLAQGSGEAITDNNSESFSDPTNTGNVVNSQEYVASNNTPSTSSENPNTTSFNPNSSSSNSTSPNSVVVDIEGNDEYSNAFNADNTSALDNNDGYTQPFNEDDESTEFTANLIRAEEVNGKSQFRYLRNLYFQLGSNTVTKDMYLHLDRVAQLMQSDSELIVRLNGHSDITGGEKLNIRLSLTRAQSAADYLMSKGVSKDRIVSQGFGAAAPLASNDDEMEGREFNRRVEIILEARD